MHGLVAVVAAVVLVHGLAGCARGRFSATVLVLRGGGRLGCSALLLLPHHDVGVAARELADRVVGVLPGLPRGQIGQGGGGWGGGMSQWRRGRTGVGRQGGSAGVASQAQRRLLAPITDHAPLRYQKPNFYPTSKHWPARVYAAHAALNGLRYEWPLKSQYLYFVAQ